jgi:hypothetical protein
MWAIERLLADLEARASTISDGRFGNGLISSMQLPYSWDLKIVENDTRQSGMVSIAGENTG